ncbi:MAG: ABC transporter permease, partial [Pseudomonas aeruginosa]|nr:ABC transporter permease [Pseudomonas aeruginosa]
LSADVIMVLVGLMTLITLVHQWLLRRSYHVAR